MSRIALFSKNHSVLLFAVLAGCFLLVPNHFVHAIVAEAFIDWAVKPAIYLFFWFFSFLVLIAANLFLWVVDAGTFTKLMNDGAIYEVWLVIRDFCNIFFILVLLFSAFATIFQLDKYEYKKTIPTLVLMALLVNFSFPISRVVIDLANVPMYFFAQNVFGTGLNNIASSLLGATEIREILIPGSTSSDVSVFSLKIGVIHLVSATVCMFLFGISFLVLAVLMLIRMIALVILVMFSPIGFVGLITPALHGVAKGWWDKLFKWAFYGPIAVMFVLVAIVVMKAAAKVHSISSTQNLSGDSIDESYIASIAYFTIPIVLFWIAITSAEKYSSEMSGMSVKFGSQLGRWAGKQVRRGAVGTAMYIPRQSGIAGGIKNAWEHRRSSLWGGSNSRIFRENQEAKVAEFFGYKGATVQNIRKQSKKYNDDSVATEELKRLAMKGDKAAAYNLAEKGELDDEAFLKIRPTLDSTKDKAVIDLLEGKVKEKRVDILLNYKINKEAEEEMKRTGVSKDVAISRVGSRVAQEEMSKISPTKLKDQNLKEMFKLRDEKGVEIAYIHRITAAGHDELIDASGAIIRSAQAELLKSKIRGTRDAFDDQSDKNKDKALDDMSGDKFALGRKLGIWRNNPYAP